MIKAAAAILALVPLALASPLARQDNTASQRIVLRSDNTLCVTANGLAPAAGDIISVSECKQPADQYYVHQFWITSGLPSTGPVQLASTNLCIDAGSATPGDNTELTLQNCDGSPQQSWYWFGGGGLEIDNECWTVADATAKTGICAGTDFKQLQTLKCASDNDQQAFDPKCEPGINCPAS